MILSSSKTFRTAYTVSFGDVSALKPEWWALEGLVVLEETLVVANLVNRDFDAYFVNAGDTVHVHRPGTFSPKHKVKGESVTTQYATASGDSVKLNQHIEVTFNIDDRDLQASMGDLRSMMLVPAIRAIAKGVDRAIVGEAGGFAIRKAAGNLGGPLTDADLIGLGRIFDENYVPEDGRNLVVGPAGKAGLLGIERFTDVSRTGGAGGNSVITGMIGEVMGFNVYMSQTVGTPLVNASGVSTAPFVINGATAKGTQTLTVDGTGADIAKGQFLTIEDTDGIYAVTAAVDATDTSIPIYPGLQGIAANDKVVYVWDGTPDVKGDHAAGSNKVITDGYTTAALIPQVGQFVAFGASLSSTSAPEVYMVTEVSGTWANNTTEITLTLNRPLDSAVSNDAAVNLGPTGGSYNMAFRSDAITLVNRPLAPAAAGVAAATQNNGTYALRVTIGYDQDVMMHKITVDTLLGVKTLDFAQGATLLC
jgi:hypothetical protein